MSFALDVNDIDHNIVRLEGTATRVHDQPAASSNAAYLARHSSVVRHPEQFAGLFSAAIIITPAKLHT